MKIYISADIEGINGTTHWNETDLDKADYAVYREQMTAEVAAACEGALAAGASEIWVKDAHDSARNLIAGRLPREARLIRGWSGHPFSMMQEIDKTFAAAVLVGYHSRAGADTNPLAHTMSGSLQLMTINGQEASEFLLAAYTASSQGVPVAFVSGDQGLCNEVAGYNPRIITVSVKEGSGDSTINIHPGLAVDLIRDGVERAVQGDLGAMLVGLPERFEVEFSYRSHVKAYQSSFYPGARLVGPRTIRLETEDYFDVLRMVQFLV